MMSKLSIIIEDSCACIQLYFVRFETLESQNNCNPYI